MITRYVAESASTDPPDRSKRRFFRLRVELLGPESGMWQGFVEVADEEVTSGNWQNAQKLADADWHCLTLKLEEAAWVHEKLGQLLAEHAASEVSAALTPPQRRRR